MNELCCRLPKQHLITVRDCKDGQLKQIVVSEETYQKIQKAIGDGEAKLYLKEAL